MLILLLVALAPERIRVMSEEAPSRFVAAFFMGLVGYLGLLVIGSLLLATVVGAPLLLVGFMVLKWMGIAAIFCAVGRRLGRAAGREMSTLGAVLLIFGLYLVVTMAPTAFGLLGVFISAVIWFLFWILVAVPALGLVILTRLGSRTEEASTPASVSAPPSSTPPQAPPPDPTPGTTDT